MMEQTALGFTVGIERKNYWDVLYKGDYTAYYVSVKANGGLSAAR